jgi:methylmalonyl-CoA mutase
LERQTKSAILSRMTAHNLPEMPFPAASEERWREHVAAVLKGADFDRTLVTRTADNIAIQPLRPAARDASPVIGANAGKPWATSARVDHPEAAEASRLALADLEGGADALTLVFQGGRGAHGFGLTAETVADLDAALGGVRLDLIRLRLDPAPAGRLNALMLAALAERRKLAPAMLDIDFGMDPIGSALSLGTVPWDWISMAPRLGETVRALMAQGFKGPFLTVDLRAVHDAGGSEAQELGYALSAATLYLRALEAHDVPLADAVKAVSFLVPVDANQFLGLAKLRALRLMMDRWQIACELAPVPIAIHAETSWRMQAKPDTHVNILRNSIATFVAGVGGADSVTTLPFTQVLGLPDEAARRLARNTSIVLQEESNLWRVADPSAGAGGIEALTADLAAAGWAAFQEIEGEGGLLVSLVLGKLQARIADKALALMKQVRSRKLPLTGTSEFPDLAETPPTVLPVKPLKLKLPKARAKGATQETDGVLKALVAGATRADVAPAASGKMTVASLPILRLSEPFEALRLAGAKVIKATKGKPPVVLVTLGSRADHGPRLTFMRGVFAAAGLEVAEIDSADAAALSKLAQPLLCLVGTDAAYAENAVPLAKSLKAKGRTLWLAGKPGELEAGLTKAGVSRFVFMGCDVVDVLETALTELAKI